MRRIASEPRPDRRERARAMGFAFAEIEGEPYWDETAHYEFTAGEVDTLEDATNEIERLTLEAVDEAVRRDARDWFGLSPAAWNLARRSWEKQERHLYGRLDLRWDGTGAPLLLEYNADTPTALFEAAVVQWEWLTCTDPSADQFNSIHEALIEGWKGMRLPGRVHFACARDSTEDRGTVDYLRDTATQAGLSTVFLHMDEIGWDGWTFRDLEESPIAAIFKLYPWDWMLAEAFGPHLATAGTRWIEPAWRLIPAGKGFLAWLWHLFPDHPNLLPAFNEPGRTGGPEVGKPFWGREGANVTAPGRPTTPGPYADQPKVWQAWAELPRFDNGSKGGGYPVIGSWIIAGGAHGMGLREDSTPITRDTSRFVPHLFRPAAESPR